MDIIKFNQFFDKNIFDKINERSTGTGIRTRFAPSPTGALHLGGVRTCLYNYLFAKKHKGTMILRIEDTDQTRFVPGAEDYIIKSLDWCGIKFDEGPHVGGPHAPYRQSERRNIYLKYVAELINNGKAYYAFDTPEEIALIKNKMGFEFSYGQKTRMYMTNSLTLSPTEVQERLKIKQPFVVRILYPEDTEIVVNDIIRGRVVMNTNDQDDKVLFKSDGLPTYHLANVVDDHLMEISHVIRGEEWLPSAPLHVYLYDSFGWKKPEFAHLPLILKPVGNGKLSKRDGDQMGFPVFPLRWEDPFDPESNSTGYKDQGYLPEAFINMLAFLGWNPGTEKEIYTMDELIQDFDLERVGKAGARFNIEKAKWWNGQHLKNMPDADAFLQLKEILHEKGIDMPDKYIKKMIEHNKTKVNFIKDIPEIASYLFIAPKGVIDQKTFKKKWTPESPVILDGLSEVLGDVNTWEADNIQKAFEGFINAGGGSFADVAPILRLSLTGLGFGPNIFEIMEMIGKRESLDRMRNFKPVIKK